MKKFLFFDGSPDFDVRWKGNSWKKDFYVIAGLVGTEAFFCSILSNELSKFRLGKKHRTKNFGEVTKIVFSKLSNDFEIFIAIFQSKRFNLTDPEIGTYNAGRNFDGPEEEAGRRGIEGRFWAQSQWVAVEYLKNGGFIPVLCMDNEKDYTAICKYHFLKQIKDIPDARFYVENDSNPPIKDSEKLLRLADYIAYYFSSTIAKGDFPDIPISSHLRIGLFYAQPLNLGIAEIPFWVNANQLPNVFDNRYLTQSTPKLI